MNFFGKMVVVVAILIAAGVLIGFVSTRSGPRPTAVSFPSATSNPATATVVSPVKETFMANNYRSLTTTATEVSTANQTIPVLVTNWEERLDKILEAKVDEKLKAQQMLELFPNLPAEGQEEFAQHLSNLVLDEDYAALAQYLTNSSLPEDVLDVLLSDALNRPNNLKLPVLVNVARDSRNPKAEEAKDLIELYLEEDYGDDWPTWENKMNEWLKNNPD
jgi:hypothetical protein